MKLKRRRKRLRGIMEDEDEKTSKEMIGIGIEVQTQFSQPAHALQFPDSWTHTQLSTPVRWTGIPKIDCSFSVSEKEDLRNCRCRRIKFANIGVKEISRKRRRNEKGNYWIIEINLRLSNPTSTLIYSVWRNFFSYYYFGPRYGPYFHSNLNINSFY